MKGFERFAIGKDEPGFDGCGFRAATQCLQHFAYAHGLADGKVDVAALQHGAGNVGPAFAQALDRGFFILPKTARKGERTLNPNEPLSRQRRHRNFNSTAFT